MHEDPIVAEVRKAGEELANRADHDVERFIALLHDAERRRLASTEAAPGAPVCGASSQPPR